jgi:hypothetical protein
MKFHSFNIIQKLVITLFVIVIIGTIFLSNPLSGYVTETKPFNKHERRLRQEPCTQDQKNAMRTRFEEARTNGVYDDDSKESTDKFIDLMVVQCSKSVPHMIEAYGNPLPFSEWKSNSPVFAWFGYISNIIQLFLAIGLISGFVFWLFKDSDHVE